VAAVNPNIAQYPERYLQGPDVSDVVVSDPQQDQGILSLLGNATAATRHDNVIDMQMAVKMQRSLGMMACPKQWP
jgi:hypothetical protein